MTVVTGADVHPIRPPRAVVKEMDVGLPETQVMPCLCVRECDVDARVDDVRLKRGVSAERGGRGGCGARQMPSSDRGRAGPDRRCEARPQGR